MNNYILPVFVAGTLLLTLFAFFLIAFLLLQNHKQNLFQIEKQKMIYGYKNEILRTRLEVQENSMNQISKEIHDNIGQLLGLAQMNMYGISDIITTERGVKLVENTNNLIGQAVNDLHNISHSLNGDLIKQLGLIDILKKELNYISSSNYIQGHMDIKGEYIDLDTEKEILIYRIVQEAIHNIIKHAQATQINIVIDNMNSNNFIISISDNGIGFDKNKLHTTNGIGFMNMHQRATYLNGNLNVQSEPLAGSIITLTIKKDQ